MSDLKDIYMAYGSFGDRKFNGRMNGKSFVKICKAAKLSKNTTSMDLCFAKIKTKGEKTITFEQFKEGLRLLGAEHKPALSGDEAEALVASCKPPQAAAGGTKAAKVALHDDKSNYTGVYAKGGPTNVDKTAVSLSSHLDRSPADARGVKH